MAPFSLSPASKRFLRKSLALLVVLVALPFLISHWQIHHWLATENCVLYRNDKNQTMSSPSSLICKGRRNRPFVIETANFSRSPPNIASLLTQISATSNQASVQSNSAPIKENLGESLRQLDLLQQQAKATAGGVYSYDYNQESWIPMNILRKPAEATVDTLEDTNASLGFRRNPDRNALQHSNESSVRIPVATYFWLLLNVGLYGWYHYQKVDSTTVAMNGQFLRDGGDFGRALSGNLSHFEIWHLGLNAMSLVQLGQVLEHDNNTMGGTIGLFLWTGSFLVLEAVWVVVLYAIDRRFGATLWRRWSGPPSRFPNMVGFSGILFAWSVAWTLSLSEFKQTCPIPFLSNLCFSTHRLAGGFRFSWGPIVQLVVIQALLHKRVSFVGHLAGTIVGFLWHWGILPPLEWSQPCILYPALWMVGKCVIYRWSSPFENLAGTTEHQGSTFGSSRTSHLGGGQVLGSGGSRWTLSDASPDENDHDESPSSKKQLLVFVERVAFLHALVLLSVYGFGLWKPMILSEVLLLLVHCLFVRAVKAGNNSNQRDGIHPLCNVGVLGRAYVAFAVIAIMTDAMTMGGWFATLRWKEIPLLVLVILLTRIPLWVVCSAAVCHILDSMNELQVHDGGIWCHVLGWSVVEPCLILAKIMVKAKWKISNHSSVRVTPRDDSEGTTPGRTISNVAGKSRLLERGTASNRGVV